MSHGAAADRGGRAAPAWSACSSYLFMSSVIAASVGACRAASRLARSHFEFVLGQAGRPERGFFIRAIPPVSRSALPPLAGRVRPAGSCGPVNTGTSPLAQRMSKRSAAAFPGANAQPVLAPRRHMGGRLTGGQFGRGAMCRC